MHVKARSKTKLEVATAAALFATLTLGCATTTTSSTTWTEPSPSTALPRTGRVESVQDIVQRVEGNPAGGALVGALTGGFVFRGRGPARLIGAAGGAAIGAAASQGSAKSRRPDDPAVHRLTAAGTPAAPEWSPA